MLKGILSFSRAGMNLHRNGSSELPSEAKIFRPVLQPSESIPPAGIRSGKGKITNTRECFSHTYTLFYKCECVFCAQRPTC